MALGVAAGGLAACGGDGGGEEPAAIEVVHEEQRAALLSVWAPDPADVWVVGGEDRGGATDDLGPIVLHFDGTGWEELDTGVRGADLWWIHGFEGGPIFIGGTGGLILRYQDGAFEELATPGTGTVFGLWGATPDDVWAVGGNAGGGGGGFAWRFDGETWRDVAEVPTDLREGGAIWKIAGRGADDIWMTGTLGYTGHFDGAALARLDVPFDVSLFGIGGDAGRFIASGGDPAIVVENAGDGWVRAELPADTLSLSGVASADGRPAYAVGQSGTIIRQDAAGEAWQLEAEVPTFRSLHAAAFDPSGDLWIAGGLFEAPDTDAGVLLHRQGSLP